MLTRKITATLSALHAVVTLRAMQIFIHIFLVWLATLLTTSAASNATVRVESAQPNSPAAVAEAEYNKLIELDDKAHEQLDKWLRDNAAVQAQGAGLETAVLTLKMNQRVEPVKKAYEDFTQRYPQHTRGHLAFGSFLHDAGDEDAAAKHWEKARELEPQNPAAWDNLGTYYAQRGEVKKALEYYAKALELNPQQSVYHHNLGNVVFHFRKEAMAYFQLSDDHALNLALKHLHTARRLAPDNFKIATDYAQAHYAVKPPRFTEAAAAWQQALKLAKTELEREGVLTHLARVEISAGHFADARQYLNTVTNASLLPLKESLTRALVEKEKPVAPKSEP